VAVGEKKSWFLCEIILVAMSTLCDWLLVARNNRHSHHMKKTLTTYDIAHELQQDSSASWSYYGAYALAEYLEELEAETGEEMELDIVAIRCDYSEYSSLRAWADEYFSDIKQASDELGVEIDMSGDEFEADEFDLDDAIRIYIRDNGQFIEFDGGIIVSSF
jgi:hypothetical protein